MVEYNAAKSQHNGTVSLQKPAWAYPRRPSDEHIQKFFSKSALEFVPTETDIFITNSKGDS